MADKHFGLDQECNFKENQKVIPTNCAFIHIIWIPADGTKPGEVLQVLELFSP